MNSRGHSDEDPTIEDLMEGPSRVSAVVVNLRREAYDVYIGRRTKWGNQYVIGRDGDRERVIELYRRFFYGSSPKAIMLKEAAVRELAGKRLGCFCKPQACHGDVLAWFVNEYIRTRGGSSHA